MYINITIFQYFYNFMIPVLNLKNIQHTIFNHLQKHCYKCTFRYQFQMQAGPLCIQNLDTKFCHPLLVSHLPYSFLIVYYMLSAPILSHTILPHLQFIPYYVFPPPVFPYILYKPIYIIHRLSITILIIYYPIPPLFQTHAEREECYVTLQKHRVGLTTDKYNLEEHNREHERLVKIGQKTEQMMPELELQKPLPSINNHFLSQFCCGINFIVVSFCLGPHTYRRMKRSLLLVPNKLPLHSQARFSINDYTN